MCRPMRHILKLMHERRIARHIDKTFPRPRPGLITGLFGSIIRKPSTMKL